MECLESGWLEKFKTLCRAGNDLLAVATLRSAPLLALARYEAPPLKSRLVNMVVSPLLQYL